VRHFTRFGGRSECSCRQSGVRKQSYTDINVDRAETDSAPAGPLWRLNPVFGIKDLLQQAQGLQAKVTALQEELAEKTVIGSAGGDMVQVTANGAQEIVSIKIEKEILSPDDPEFLEDLIVAAANDALKKSKELMTQEMSKLTGGLRIPGLT
jgi:nucleoid-associated protein EbfC